MAVGSAEGVQMEEDIMEKDGAMVMQSRKTVVV